MGDVVNFGTKPSKPPSIDVKQLMIDQLSNVEEEITSGIILLRTKDSDIIDGFFETSFQDEAVMSKTLEYDMFLRQQARSFQEGYDG